MFALLQSIERHMKANALFTSPNPSQDSLDFKYHSPICFPLFEMAFLPSVSVALSVRNPSLSRLLSLSSEPLPLPFRPLSGVFSVSLYCLPQLSTALRSVQKSPCARRTVSLKSSGNGLLREFRHQVKACFCLLDWLVFFCVLFCMVSFC